MSKFARMESCCSPDSNCASYIRSRWKKQYIEIPPRFHQEFLDYVRSALQVCAWGLPNATALRQSVRKIYPRDTNTRSSGFLEVGAVWISGLDKCHRLRNCGFFWKWFSLSRGKPGGKILCENPRYFRYFVGFFSSLSPVTWLWLSVCVFMAFMANSLVL